MKNVQGALPRRSAQGAAGVAWGMMLAVASLEGGVLAASKPAPGVLPPAAGDFARFVTELPPGDSQHLLFGKPGGGRLSAGGPVQTTALGGVKAGLVRPGEKLALALGAGLPLSQGGILLVQYHDQGGDGCAVTWAPQGGTPSRHALGRGGTETWRTAAVEVAPAASGRGRLEFSLEGTGAAEGLALAGVALVSVSHPERAQFRQMRGRLRQAGASLDALLCRRQSLSLLAGQVKRALALGLPVRAGSEMERWKEAERQRRALEGRYDALYQLAGPLLILGKRGDWAAHLEQVERDAARLDGTFTALNTRLLAALSRAGVRPPVLAARSAEPPYLGLGGEPGTVWNGFDFVVEGSAKPGNAALRWRGGAAPPEWDTPVTFRGGAGDNGEAPPVWVREPWPAGRPQAAAASTLRARLWQRFASGAVAVALAGNGDGRAVPAGLCDPRYGGDRISAALGAACAVRDEVRRLWTILWTTAPQERATAGPLPQRNGNPAGKARSNHRDLWVQERRATHGRVLLLLNESPARALTATVTVPGGYSRATDLAIGPGAGLRITADGKTTRFSITLDPGEATLVALIR